MKQKDSSYGMWDPDAKCLDKQWWETAREQWEFVNDLRGGIGLEPILKKDNEKK